MTIENLLKRIETELNTSIDPDDDYGAGYIQALKDIKHHLTLIIQHKQKGDQNG